MSNMIYIANQSDVVFMPENPGLFSDIFHSLEDAYGGLILHFAGKKSSSSKKRNNRKKTTQPKKPKQPLPQPEENELKPNEEPLNEAPNETDSSLSDVPSSEPIDEISEPVVDDTKDEEPVDETSDSASSAEEVQEETSESNPESDVSNIPPNDEPPQKPKKKKGMKILAVIVSILVVMELIVGCVGLGYLKKLLDGKPELNIEQLKSPDSTIIYDSEGNVIVELGLYLRENIPYEEMPTSLVDAFLAIEDSRYFSHFGFDIPRFTQAAITNLKTRDFSQGGSTITMQLIKNSYFQVDAGSDSTLADREGASGIKRKAQEIALAMELDRSMSKEDIFALFLNKINFGNNIRGVEKAAQYYFNKNASELNLCESAFLAGIINSPNSFNPYNDLSKNNGDNIYLNPNTEYLENAQTRKNEVLDLMLYHGYITEEECALGKTVRMEDLLSGLSKQWTTSGSYYQSYIDAVIEEAQEVTGKDPYSTSMKIYTGMDEHIQELVYNIQNEKTDIKFRQENSQNALVVLDNQSGTLIALGGGRNQTEARMFNRATSAKIQPGSTIKPIFEYALAFDKLGWATSYTITDRPIYLYNGHNLIRNAGGQGYYGDMLITEAVARSLNTPAVQALMAVVEETSEEECVDYLKSIGFNVEYEDFDLQFAIGGNRLTVTPVQLAAAHAVLMNDGYYIKPHTITRIEMGDGSDDYVADTIGQSVLSPAAAYMAAYCEEYNVSGPFFNYMQVLRSSYPVYAKTGTTDWGNSGLSYGIPRGAAKDSWLVCQTNHYTVTIWMGFDSAGKGTYFTTADDRANIKGHIGKMILDELNDYFAYEPSALEQPDDCVKFTHMRGVYPYCYASGGVPVTGLVKKEYANLIDISQIPRIEKAGVFTGMNASYNGDGTITINWLGFGGASGDTKDISATNAFGETTQAVGRNYYNLYNYTRPAYFYADIFVNGVHVNSISSESPSYVSSTYAEAGSTITVCGYTSDSSSQKCTDIRN